MILVISVNAAVATVVVAAASVGSRQQCLSGSFQDDTLLTRKNPKGMLMFFCERWARVLFALRSNQVAGKGKRMSIEIKLSVYVAGKGERMSSFTLWGFRLVVPSEFRFFCCYVMFHFEIRYFFKVLSYTYSQLRCAEQLSFFSNSHTQALYFIRVSN